MASEIAAGNRELVMLVDVLAREKNVPRDIVFGALEMALAFGHPSVRALKMMGAFPGPRSIAGYAGSVRKIPNIGPCLGGLGFAPDVERIIDRTTPDRQTALFSATVPSWVKQTASKHLHDPETVTIVPEPGEVTPSLSPVKSFGER